ncbi:MAG: NUDIX domain-containing protein [Hyphomicrobiaceae bacterium]
MREGRTGMTYDYLVCIGRFQPFHIGHRHVIQAMLDKARHAIILVGSPNVSRSLRNPFTYEERANMIRAVFSEAAASGQLMIRPVDDYDYNETAQVAAIQRAIDAAMRDAAKLPSSASGAKDNVRKGFVNCGSDTQVRCLGFFPDWNVVEVKQPAGRFDAKHICSRFIRPKPMLPRKACPPEVIKLLASFSQTREFASLVEEAKYIAGFKKSWAAAPYPPTFVTVDCVVEQAGHVLLVRRRGQPGRGLLALPGGFVDVSEPLRDAAIRELKEETNIADANGPIAPEVLVSFIDNAKTQVFDAPDRSARGRTITHAYLFRCPHGDTLFDVKGGDDAASAQWHRIGDLDPRDFFEDHWFILQAMTGFCLGPAQSSD